jgi:hypothetical protein
LEDATDEAFIEVYNDSGVDLCFTLSVMDTGAIRLRDSSGATVATSDGGKVSEDVWHYLIVDAIIDNSADVVVYIDGNAIINESAVDTSQGETIVDMIYFAGASDSSGKGVWWDDIVVMDGSGSEMNGLQGDCRILTLLPDDTTSTDDWSVLGGGDSDAAVDDPVPGSDDDDTTYVFDPTDSNDSVRWDYEDVPGTYTVKAVGMAIAGRKTDSGPGQIQAQAYGSATLHNGTVFQLSTSYQLFRHFMELAADGGAWSPSEVNSTEFGVAIYFPV